MIWRGGRGREPVTVTDTVPPADVVPVDTPEMVAAEQHARMRHVSRLAYRTLQAESEKPCALRNTALTDFCLEALSGLQPSEPEVRREPPLPVQDRYPIPVIAGVTP